MTLTNSIAAKLVVAAVAIAMAFSFVAPAQAEDVSDMSLEELIALVNQLQAQLAGGDDSMSGSCSYTWTRSLSTGSTGEDVMNLQKFLNMSADTQVSVSGAGAPGSETSYYGPATAAAVSKFQTKYSADILVPVGLTSPTGYFGPSTMAKANSVCSGMSDDGSMSDDDDDDSSSADLEGGAGSIEDADFMSKLNNEEVGEDEDDVQVMGMEIEADDNSDIELTAVGIDFDKGASDNRDFHKYASEVSVWFDGEEVARVDADEFEDDDEYGKTVSLDSGAIIRAGETGELVVAVSGVSNLDSTDATDKWDVAFTSVRFRDGQGAVISDTSTGDIGDDNDTTAVGTNEREFSFEDFASAADLDVKISSGDDDINDSRSIEVDDNNDTDNVELLSFELEVEGDSDVTIDDFEINGTSVGAGVGEIVNTLELVVDGDVIGSESVASTSATTHEQIFDNLDWTVKAGETVEVIVRADLNNLSGGFTAGDTLFLTVDSQDAGWDIEDENGDDVVTGDRSGSETSDPHTFYADGIQVVQDSVSTSLHPGDNDDDDYVTLTIKFDVTAFGQAAYVQKALDVTTGTGLTGTTPTDAVGVHIQSADGDLTTGHVSAVLSSTADEKTNTFEVKENQTETFTITATVANAATSTLDQANVRAVLAGVGFAASDVTTSAQMFTSNVDDIKTDYAYIAN